MNDGEWTRSFRQPRFIFRIYCISLSLKRTFNHEDDRSLISGRTSNSFGDRTASFPHLHEVKRRLRTSFQRESKEKEERARFSFFRDSRIFLRSSLVALFLNHNLLPHSMGCQQSMPVESPGTTSKKSPSSASIVEPPQSAKARASTSSKKRPMGVGATERLASNRQKKMASIVGQGDDAEKPKLDGTGHLMMEEIVKRTNSSVKNSVVTLGRQGKGNTVQVRYAYWTQRGYYPDGKSCDSFLAWIVVML
jgi:hypothetical protein